MRFRTGAAIAVLSVALLAACTSTAPRDGGGDGGGGGGDDGPGDGLDGGAGGGLGEGEADGVADGVADAGAGGAGGASGAGGAGDGLADTGGRFTVGMLLLIVSLLVLGTFLVMASRRRKAAVLDGF